MRFGRELPLLLTFNFLVIALFTYLFSRPPPSQVSRIAPDDGQPPDTVQNNPEALQFAPVKVLSHDQRESGESKQKYCMVPPKERHFHRLLYSYDTCFKKWVDQLVKEKRPYDDPELIKLAQFMLEPPSKHLTKASRAIVETPQSTEIKNILNDKKGGFFIEVGAFDGERSSNSFWLETKRKWSGLLIEMDPYYYTMLKGHSRHSWVINCCLSLYKHPVLMNFTESDGGTGRLDTKNSRPHSRLISQVPCLPLYTLLLAIGQTHIDYFSLDVEGVELDILRTVPFDKLDISTLSVEFLHGEEGKQAILDHMTQQGYDMVKKITTGSVHVNDFIFVKKT